MTDTTKRLLDQQSKLGKKLEDLLPLVDKGMGVLNQVGGPQGVQKMLETLEQFSSNIAPTATQPQDNNGGKASKKV